MERKRGRPRNVKTQQAILAASYELLQELGFGTITVEKIAERAQVSKATIYKWWPNKAAVVMDAFLFAATERLPVPDTGSVFEDIPLHAANLVRFLTSREGKLLTEIIGEGQLDPAIAEAYRTRYFQPRRQEAMSLLEQGIRRGELRPDIEVPVAADLLYGPIFYRLLVTGDPLDDMYVRRLTASAFEGLRSK